MFGWVGIAKMRACAVTVDLFLQQLVADGVVGSQVARAFLKIIKLVLVRPLTLHQIHLRICDSPLPVSGN